MSRDEVFEVPRRMINEVQITALCRSLFRQAVFVALLFCLISFATLLAHCDLVWLRSQRENWNDGHAQNNNNHPHQTHNTFILSQHAGFLLSLFRGLPGISTFLLMADEEHAFLWSWQRTDRKNFCLRWHCTWNSEPFSWWALVAIPTCSWHFSSCWSCSPRICWKMKEWLFSVCFHF